MKINVHARLFVHPMLKNIGGSNPPIAELEGEYEVEITTPVEFEAFYLRHMVRLNNHFLHIVNYDVEHNLLYLNTHLPQDDIPGADIITSIEKFIASYVDPGSIWKIDHDAIKLYERRR